jgi:hypothetical protein
VSNIDIVIVAAYKLNAHHKYVDTEDIAILANQLAPGRFSWRKYNEQINLEHVRVRLFDAAKVDSELLIGNKRDGWLLTKKGLEHAESLAPLLGAVDLSRIIQTDEEKRRDQWLQRERLRMLSSEILARFLEDGGTTITDRDAEGFFKLDEYIQGASRQRKVQRLMRAFSNDPQLGAAVHALSAKVLKD